MKRKANVLISYEYWKKRPLSEVNSIISRTNCLIDSGAFSAFKSGVKITVEDYSDWLKSLRGRPFGYFNLDVIGDPKASRKQYGQMLNLGHKPIPVVTRGDSLDIVDEYYETASVIAIGGLVGLPRPGNHIARVMSRISTRKVHWLGYANVGMLKRYRPAMCDSSVLANVSRFGCIPLYDPLTKKMLHLRREGFSDPKTAMKHADVLARVGIEPHELHKAVGWKSEVTGAATRASYRSGCAFSIDLEKNIGTKFFTVCINAANIESAVEAMDFHNKRDGLT